MPITTYAELKTSIADFLNRDDVAAISSTYISKAEADMNRQLRHFRQEKRSTVSITGQYSTLPTDYLETIRFYITGGDTNPLELISQSQLLDRKFRNLNTSGNPRYYAITAGEIEVYPVPDGTYTSELYYYGKTPALSDNNTSNWILEHHPDAYLYGSLIHSAVYLKEDERLKVWAALYQSAIDAINQESEKAKFSGSGLRMKIRSY